MEGSSHDGKDGSTSLAAKDSEVPCTEIESTVPTESLEVSEGASNNDGFNKQSDLGDERGNKDDENAMNSKVPDDNDKAEEIEEEEQWDLKRIMSIAAVVRKSPIKCSHESCNLIAATVWVSNLKPSENWYSCLDCQENDFDGWPDPDELPLKYMTQEHKETLIAKCSKYKDCSFPDFSDKSPSKDETKTLPSIVTATVITPLSHSAVSVEKRLENPDPAQSTVTPNHSEMNVEVRNIASKKAALGATKPNKAQLEIHRKWQAAAEELGGPGARIVLHKPLAKKMIFDFLFDAFRPMNITDIHKGLRAQIPSPILKACLDDMALDNDSHTPFVDTDHESEDDEPQKSVAIKKPAPEGTENQFKNSLSFKGGKGSHSGLFYVNYNNATGGSGMDTEDKNKLFDDSVNADAKLVEIKRTVSTIRCTIEKLLSEPMNADLNMLLKNAEAESCDLSGQLEEARKLTVNVEHILRTKKKIEHFASIWRKRRKLCMDFLITMEELTDGAVSLKKCQAGDGPIEIDCDEACAKLAIEFAKKKMNQAGIGKVKKSVAMSKSSVQSVSKFAAVMLDSQGKVQRIHIDSHSN